MECSALCLLGYLLLVFYTPTSAKMSSSNQMSIKPLQSGPDQTAEVLVAMLDSGYDGRGLRIVPPSELIATLPCVKDVSMMSIEPGKVRGNHAMPIAESWIVHAPGPWTLFYVSVILTRVR